MEIMAVARGAVTGAVALAQGEGEAAGLVINLFWVLVSAANFLIFLAIIWAFAYGPISRTLAERRARIERGLQDADQARRDREAAEHERSAALAEARREANEILARAQKVATETREADIAMTKVELGRMRERASGEIEAEKSRAIAELRSEVADLALMAAGKVVGESMTDARQRRLVEEFLAQTGRRGGRRA